jgi:hypothetical protein
MTGKVEIINIALARLGESPIQSFEEGSVPANSARLVYDSARRSTLRDYNWNFAVATAELARYADTQAGDFPFAFALPADCLRVIRLPPSPQGLRRTSRLATPPGQVRSRTCGDFGRNLPFTLRGGKLLAHEPKVVLEYLRDVTDENEFDAKFIEALTYKLASELAMPVKGSAELMASYSNAYQTLINRAATESAWEEREPRSGNPYLEARF